jgi:hypothetical protein
MDPASIINFLSNEDTQELAPGFFIPSAFRPRVRFDELGHAGKNSRLTELVSKLRF